MKYAILLRHATAGDAPSDALRELTPEGRREAERAGQALAALGAPWQPTRAICSDALRASATFEAARAALPSVAHVDFQAALYLGAPGSLLGALQAAPADDACVLVVAHEPGLSACVRLLARRAVPEARDGFARGMAPAAFAALQLEVARWEELAPGCGALVAFLRP